MKPITAAILVKLVQYLDTFIRILHECFIPHKNVLQDAVYVDYLMHITKNTYYSKQI